MERLRTQFGKEARIKCSLVAHVIWGDVGWFESNILDKFNMFISTGPLQYSIENGKYKLIVEVDTEIANYYRSLIPNYLRVKRQKYPAHISVVRNEEVVNLLEWGKYQNQEVTFWYNGIIHNDEAYFWLQANSLELQDIRVKLGLTSSSRITRSPDGQHTFHISLGNIK